MTTYFDAKVVNGPYLAAWLEDNGLIPERPEVFDAAMARNLRKWRAGVWPHVDTVDRVCILLGFHAAELPDDMWAAEVPQDFPPRSCASCGKDMPRLRRTKDGCRVWETRNEYMAKTTCSHGCASVRATSSRKARKPVAA